jgi:undecaprenyl-diphosphatase
MEWYMALFFGVVQGLTEFLPVSSSGHLQIFNELFHCGTGEENMMFTVVVHAATVCSTIVAFRKEILALIAGLFRFKWNPETEYLAKIAISMIPIMVVGLFFKDYVESIFGSGILVVGICLMITAFLLAFSYYAKPRQKESISFKDAFIIGLAQSIAVLPGLSRSGTTISTGLLLGDKREHVAKFSFLMVLVPILGEAFLELISGEMGATSIPVSSLVIGFIAAFVSGYMACTWMIRLVAKGKLIYFAYYCLIVGLTIVLTNIF